MAFLDRTFLAALAVVAGATAAVAQPADSTCRFLHVMGSNDAGAVAGLIGEIASRLPDEQRRAATNQLSALLGAPLFAGGSAWRIAAFGEELEEHLVLLRLSDGEVAGARIRYEWSEDGLSLVHLEFHRQYQQYMDPPPTMTPEPIACSGD